MVSNKVVVMCTVAIVLAIVFAAVVANPGIVRGLSVELNKLKAKPQLPANCHYTGDYTYKGDPAYTCV